MHLLQGPSDWFVRAVERIDAREPTKAYIVGVLLDFVRPSNDAQFVSIVAAYADAISAGRFERFQMLGDWVLWSMTLVPATHSGHERIVVELGRRSYDACWRILRGEWDVYAELADGFPSIVEGVRSGLK